MSSMPRKLPLHVVREKSRHGKVKFFYRVGKGERVRLPDNLTSDEFKQAYVQAVSDYRPKVYKSITAAPTNSLRWLVDRYKESAAWRAYSQATRKQQENFFLSALKNSGNAPFASIDRKSILAALEARSETPALANNFLKAMRALFSWAQRNDHVQTNPTDGVQRLKYKSDGFEAWTFDDLERFYNMWPVGTKQRLAVELLVHSGLRRSDIVLAGKQHMNGNIFSIKTAKTGTQITVEFPPSLIETIYATATGDLHFLITEYGRPYTKEGFGNWFRDQCNAAGISKSAHGIRKLSATIAADAGAAAHELMAQYGWTNVKQAEHYTKGADRKSLGIKSSKRISDQIENRLSRTLHSGAGKINNK